MRAAYQGGFLLLRHFYRCLASVLLVTGNCLAKLTAGRTRLGKVRFMVFCVIASASALPVACLCAPASANVADADFAITRNDIDATLALGQAVNIDNPYGDVRVSFGGFEHKIETHVVLQEPPGAEAIALAPAVASDGRYTVAPRLPVGALLHEGQRLDLSVFLPEGHALRVRTEQGAIEVHGAHGDLDLKSVAGNIGLRGNKGAILAETGEGSIEASLASAPRHSAQRLATTTGEILVGVDDQLDAEVTMTTSAHFATDYSLKVTRQDGVEPNKLARAVVGENHAKILLESRRGQITLLRRARFKLVGSASSTSAVEQDESEDNDSD